MSAQRQVLQRMTDQFRTVLVGMHGARVASFVRLVVGIVLAHSVSLPKVEQALALGRKAGTTERQLRRVLANPNLAPEDVWAELRPVVLQDWTNRELVVVLDGTPQGKAFTVLTLGVVAHGRTLPLGNVVLPQQTSWGIDLVTAITPICDGIAAALPPGATVTVVADRGLSGPGLVDLCRRLGWHWVLRIAVTATTDHLARRADGRRVRLWSLVAPVRWQHVEAVALFASAGERAGWLTVRADPRYEEPWVLFSDRPGGGARVQEYRRRQTIEPMFQDRKRRGCGVESSHLRHADRIERLLLAVDLGYWWLQYLGGDAIRHGRRREVDRANRRDCSRLAIGWRIVDRAIAAGARLSLPFHWRNGQWHYPALLA